MEEIMKYIRPELLVLSAVLYFIGMGIKKMETIPDRYIPAILGALGCLLSGIYVLGSCPLGTMQEIAMAVFTAIVQGILVAGLSTYINQMGKQMTKKE